MNALYWFVALGLLANVGVGLAFVARRRGGVESLLAAQMFGTIGVALTLMLGKATEDPRAIDIALVFAVLAAVLGVAFARLGFASSDRDEGGLT